MKTHILVFYFIYLLISTGCLVVQGQGHIIEQTSMAGFKLSIYLPPAYDENQSYKILYFNDGQTVFGEAGLNMDGMADELILKDLIEPVIIVGIHSDENRTSNYVPYLDASAIADFGPYQANADKYSQKIVEQLIPAIEKKYKAKADRGIGGYSFGGLQASWIALNYPDQFSFSGALSPSYWVKEFEIFKEGSKAKPNQVYYFDIGTGEWNYYVPMLLYSQLPILKNIFYYEDYKAHHSVEYWKGQRIKNLLLLFAGTTDLTKYNWEIQLEIIKSAYSGRFFPRINPIITYANGLKASISYAATFTVTNPGDGVVNKDGSFYFINPQDLNVKINYNGEEKTMVINYKEVEKIKAGL